MLRMKYSSYLVVDNGTSTAKKLENRVPVKIGLQFKEGRTRRNPRRRERYGGPCQTAESGTFAMGRGGYE